MFHNGKSTREKGTLANICVCYGHKNVLQNTKKCFNATYEFIDCITTSYIVVLAVKYMGVTDIKNPPPQMPQQIEEKRTYLRSLADKVSKIFPQDVSYSSNKYMLYIFTERSLSQEIHPFQITNAIFMPVNTEDVLAAPDNDGSDFPWCLCKENCGGTMIFCDNPSCPRGEWFHVDCLDLCEEVNELHF